MPTKVRFVEIETDTAEETDILGRAMERLLPGRWPPSGPVEAPPLSALPEITAAVPLAAELPVPLPTASVEHPSKPPAPESKPRRASGPFTCSHCKRIFTRSQGLGRHLRHCAGPVAQPSKAAAVRPKPSKAAAVPPKPQSTRIAVHVGGAHKCPVCHASFDKAQGLAIHLGLKHGQRGRSYAKPATGRYRIPAVPTLERLDPDPSATQAADLQDADLLDPDDPFGDGRPMPSEAK